MLIEHDQDTIDELRAEVAHEKRLRARLAAHPDPRDPDHPEPDEDTSLQDAITSIGEWLSMAKLAWAKGDEARIIQCLNEINAESASALGMD